MEEENREEAEEEPKEEAKDELVPEPPAPTETKPTDDAKEVCEESQDQEGKDEDNSPRPETAEENPLEIFERRKVTRAKGWIVWEMGPWAQMPPGFRVIQPRMDFYRSRGGKSGDGGGIGESGLSVGNGRLNQFAVELYGKGHLCWEPGWGYWFPGKVVFAVQFHSELEFPLFLYVVACYLCQEGAPLP